MSVCQISFVFVGCGGSIPKGCTRASECFVIPPLPPAFLLHLHQLPLPFHLGSCALAQNPNILSGLSTLYLIQGEGDYDNETRLEPLEVTRGIVTFVVKAGKR